MQKTLLHNQSLLDFTLNHCGTLLSIVEIAAENNIGITEALASGVVLSIPGNAKRDQNIVDFYTNKRIVPASGFALRNNQRLENVFAYEFTISL